MIKIDMRDIGKITSDDLSAIGCGFAAIEAERKGFVTDAMFLHEKTAYKLLQEAKQSSPSLFEMVSTHYLKAAELAEKQGLRGMQRQYSRLGGDYFLKAND